MTFRKLSRCLAVGLCVSWPGVSAPQTLPRDPEAAKTIAEVQAYLNGLTSLQAEFMQVAPDGSVSQGTLLLARPGGRIRLDYAPPSQLLVIGNKGWVTLRDEGADEDSRWPVGGTPFEVLIADHVDLEKDVRVRRSDRAGGVVRVTVEGRDEPEAGSLTLIFAEQPMELRQWQVLDAQRLLTTVTLGDTQSNVRIDSDLFIEHDPTLWGD